MWFIPVMQSWIFSQIIVIWWFAGQETILITINAGNSCAASFLRILLLIVIIDVFTATLDQLISFLLNKSDNLFLKNILSTPRFWTAVYMV